MNSRAAALGRLYSGIPRAMRKPSRSITASSRLGAIRCIGAPALVSRLAPSLVSRLGFLTRAASELQAGGAVDASGDSSRSEDEDEVGEKGGDGDVSDRARKASKWMIVGLGNPGSKFVGTRHNVGFEAIDLLAQQENIKLNTIQCKALVGKGLIHGVPVLLVKPQTYMNLSGDAVSPLALYYRVQSHNILVIMDDMDLEVADMKLKPKGRPGGQKGLMHIISRFKDNINIPRLRIGIGRPPGAMDPKAYVLQKFTPRERVEIEVCYERAADAVRLIMSEGFTQALSKWKAPRRSRDPTAVVKPQRSSK